MTSIKPDFCGPLRDTLVSDATFTLTSNVFRPESTVCCCKSNLIYMCESLENIVGFREPYLNPSYQPLGPEYWAKVLKKIWYAKSAIDGIFIIEGCGHIWYFHSTERLLRDTPMLNRYL
jgi:hypothetical protein